MLCAGQKLARTGRDEVSPFQGFSVDDDRDSAFVLPTVAVGSKAERGPATSTGGSWAGPTEERLPPMSSPVVGSQDQAQSNIMRFVFTSANGLDVFGPQQLLDPSWVSTHQSLIVDLLRVGHVSCRLAIT